MVGMNNVIGWLRLKPGRRDDLLARARPFAEASRQEEGVVFFEVNPSDTEADVVTFIECYESEGVHQRHLATEEHDALLQDIARIGVGGRFHHVYPERTDTNDPQLRGVTLPSAASTAQWSRRAF